MRQGQVSRRAIMGMSVYTAALVACVLCFGCSVKDSTDPPDGVSGIAPYTDNLTGCQYLGYGLGGLTPRMGPDGKQICTPRHATN